MKILFWLYAGIGEPLCLWGFMMADLSIAFDFSDILSKATDAVSKASEASVAAAKGSDASSKIATKSTTWDKASAASSAVIVAQSKASDASSRAVAASTAAATAQSKASDASSAVVALDATVIKSVPGSGSRAVHEIIYTAASEIKYVYSSNAEA
jgi:hypothetical protein